MRSTDGVFERDLLSESERLTLRVAETVTSTVDDADALRETDSVAESVVESVVEVERDAVSVVLAVRERDADTEAVLPTVSEGDGKRVVDREFVTDPVDVWLRVLLQLRVELAVVLWV